MLQVYLLLGILGLLYVKSNKQKESFSKIEYVNVEDHYDDVKEAAKGSWFRQVLF